MDMRSVTKRINICASFEEQYIIQTCFQLFKVLEI